MSFNMPPMKPAPNPLLMAMSLLLPVVLALCTHMFVNALMQVGDHDRAIVWAQGEHDAVVSARTALMSNYVFSSGRVIPASATLQRPDTCGDHAVELSFGRLQVAMAQAAREELEHLAHASGLQVCATGLFRINDASTDTVAGRSGFAAQHLLLYLLVPGGICLSLYWMFREQFALPALRPGAGVQRHLALGAAAALVLFLVVVAANGAVGLPWHGGQPDDASGLDTNAIILLLALAAFSPMIDELAYRAWLITLAERTLGTLGAGTFSTSVFVLSYRPTTLHETFSLLGIGAVCSLLYVRTRSLVAPVAAHAGFALASLAASAAWG
ncbi:CPBP family intramembrane glutamic endopeptidase [Arenimonas daejeonensis]|uniref:CPBP family intramembrane glutamic endopeptidase n=1 Tax=Arenimonas daejeonensis TaxID=370777 RepID=UPI0011BD734E|nr:CPBP family intramembrane glutamic endopeptidase [Arenimonas daejeonensis]